MKEFPKQMETQSMFVDGKTQYQKKPKNLRAFLLKINAHTVKNPNMMFRKLPLAP
jgi:hypothetical protein